MTRSLPPALAFGTLALGGVLFAVVGLRMIRAEGAAAETDAQRLLAETLRVAVRKSSEIAETGPAPSTWEFEVPPAADPLADASPEDRLLLDEARYRERHDEDATEATSILVRLVEKAPTSQVGQIAAARAAAIAARTGDTETANKAIRVAHGAPKAVVDPDSMQPVSRVALYLAARSPVHSKGSVAEAQLLIDDARNGRLLRADGGPDAADLLIALAEEPGDGRFEMDVFMAASQGRLGHALLRHVHEPGTAVAQELVVRRTSSGIGAWTLDEFAAALTRVAGRPGFAIALAPTSSGSSSGGASADLEGPLRGLTLHVRPTTSAPTGAGAVLVLLGGLAVYFLGAFLAVAALRRSARIARMQADFVAAVSHEMKTPIAAVAAMAEMLADGRVPDPERARTYAERIRAECQRLGATVRNVLDAARIERGVEAMVRPRPEDPAAVVEGIAAAFRPAIEGRGFRFDVRTSPAPRPVPLDPDAMTSVIANLLDNAVKFTADGGRKEVTVVAGPQNGSYRIAVLDRGPGVPPADKTRVFERFFRGEAAKSDAVPGVGLGLHVAAEIVRAHGGSVRIEDREGGGAAFLVDLPLAGPPKESAS